MRIAKIVSAAVAAISFLQGCSVYKDYERPAVSFADSLYVAADTASVADLGWRDFFTDPMLQALIDTGLVNNCDILAARERVIQARAGLRAAHLAFLPGVNLSPSYSYAYSQERYSNDAQGYSLPLSASWEMDFSGKYLVSRRKAQAELARNEVAVLSVRTELISAIAEYYYTLEMLDAKLYVSRTTAESWKENVRIMKLMKEAGMTNEASVSQTEANACSIETSVYDLQCQITQTENNLAVLLGVTPRSFERGTLGSDRIFTDLRTGVPARLLSNRPDVMMAELALRRCFYDKALAHAAFYPSVTISAEAGWSKALTSPEGWLVSLGAGLVQPLFRRGALTANLRVAESEERIAATTFRQTLLKAGAEVNNALAKCRSVEEKKSARDAQIEALKSAENSTKSLMRHAESTYLEVLTAQQSLLSARLQQITDSYDYIQGAIALYKALGGGI